MRIKKNDIISTLIILSFLFFFISFINGNLNDKLSSYLMVLLFILNVFCLIINSKKIKKESNILLLFILTILIIIYIILSISGIGSYLNILNLTFIIYTTKNLELGQKNYKTIFYISLILLLFLFYKSLNVWNSFVLNINNVNPNVLAQSLLLCFSIVCSNINVIEKNRKKILFILNILTIIAIYLCNCRTALLSILIYTFILYSKKGKNLINNNYKKILLLILIVGFLIPIVYVYMYNNNITFKIPFTTKEIFTGREILWKNIIIILNENKIGYLTGLGSHYITSIGIIDNLHTWYLGSVYLYGIPITIIYFYYLITEFSNLNNLLTKLSIISIFIIGFFETSALWSNSQFLIFVLLLLDNRKVEIISE